MGQPNQQLPSTPSLDQLIADALRHLEKLGYSRRSLRRYRTTWEYLLAFSREHNLGDGYSPDVTARFVDAVRVTDGDQVDSHSGWRRHVVYSVKVLEDFARDGRIERFRTDMQKVKVPPVMKKALRDYEKYAKDRQHLRASTLTERIREIAIFLDFLGGRNLTTWAQLQPVDVATFVTSRQCLRPKTVSRIVSDVRLFLKFLLLRGIVQRDLSQALPKIRVARDAAIPSIWEPELLTRLLEVVDRGSPKGRRDYAILLLACRLGLRLGDIRALTLDQINWDAATVEITQSKTGAPLTLPLTEEVGAALIDYLRSGRPQTHHREVFLKMKRPIAPFGRDSHLHFIVTYWKNLAGIKFPTAQRHGLHSLRHTLATQLLREGTPIHIISDILGHTTTASTLIYAKADVEALRSAALATEEVSDVD